MQKKLNLKITTVSDFPDDHKEWRTGGIIQHIMDENDRFRQRVAYLKAKSNYYPKIYTEIIDDTMFLSTLVRVFRGETWWKIHCVEAASQRMFIDPSILLSRFCGAVHRIQHLMVVDTNLVDQEGNRVFIPDECQLSETERLIKEITWEHGKR